MAQQPKSEQAKRGVTPLTARGRERQFAPLPPLPNDREIPRAQLRSHAWHDTYTNIDIPVGLTSQPPIQLQFKGWYYVCASRGTYPEAAAALMVVHDASAGPTKLANAPRIA